MAENNQIQVCKLCEISPATQTGSHLLSCFIVESMAGKRGSEKIHILSDDPNLDHLENLGNKAVTQDYLFCRGCEQRMSYLESYISQEFINKINLVTQKENFPKIKITPTYYIKECLRLNSAAFILLIALLIWRISISTLIGFSQFKLKESESNALRKILNELLPPYSNYKVKPNKMEWLKYISSQINNYELFSFIIIAPETNHNKTSNLVLAPDFIDYPYSLLLNEFIILIYFGKFDASKIQEDFYGLGELIQDIDAINSVGNNIKVAYIPEDKWESIKTRFMNEQSERKFKAMVRSKIEEYIKVHRKKPSSEQILGFVEAIKNEIDKA